jgi:fructose-specific phosphotransferase system IIA component
MSLFDEKLIFLNYDSKNKKDILKNLSKEIENLGYVDSHKKFSKALLEREKHSTTGIGFNIAIPHGKSPSVHEPFVAFAKPKRPVEWESLDDEPVEMIFLIGVPEQSANEHLKILQKLSVSLMDEKFRENLKEAETKEEILDLVKDIE